MIEEPPLLTVRGERSRPTAGQIEALTGVPTGFVVDAMDGHGALASGIRALSPTALPASLCGPVLSCLCGPGDILALLGALSEVRAGDVVVAATGDWHGCAVMGDRVAGMLVNAGAAGFVTDGVVRDVAGIESTGLSVHCAGVSPNSPVSSGPGEIGTPIVVGGVAVDSGDLIVADEDGVVVVPFARIDAVLERVRRIAALEQELDARVAAGLAVPDDIAELMRSDRVRRI